MRIFMIAAAVALSTTCAYADSTCTSQATDKKLAGAAKTSFMTKCEKDATASCDKQAADKKLAGAAKNVAWKRAVPGSGWSSPVVAGGRVYLTTSVAVTGGPNGDQSLRALSNTS